MIAMATAVPAMSPPISHIRRRCCACWYPYRLGAARRPAGPAGYLPGVAAEEEHLRAARVAPARATGRTGGGPARRGPEIGRGGLPAAVLGRRPQPFDGWTVVGATVAGCTLVDCTLVAPTEVTAGW